MMCITVISLIDTLRWRQKDILQTIFSCAFCSMEISVFPKAQLTICHHCWHRRGDKPISQPMLRKCLTHICTTRPRQFHQNDGISCNRFYSSVKIPLNKVIMEYLRITAKKSYLLYVIWYYWKSALCDCKCYIIFLIHQHRNFLTHLPRTKWPPLRRHHFQMHFLE